MGCTGRTIPPGGLRRSGTPPPGALRFRTVAKDPNPDIKLTDLSGTTETLGVRLTLFNMLAVVLDPYTHQSGWIIPTAARILDNYEETDTRCAFIVASDPEGARQFLGPYAERYLVLTDPDRELISSLELEHLPAILHFRQDVTVHSSAEGWDPPAWVLVLKDLEKDMNWYSNPVLPAPADPPPFEGTPAIP